jgi:hypothetical protein
MDRMDADEEKISLSAFIRVIRGLSSFFPARPMRTRGRAGNPRSAGGERMSGRVTYFH